MNDLGGGNSVEWYTPPSIFDALGVSFDLDPASPLSGPVPWVPASRFLSAREDGLATPWQGRVWLNPPYGRDVVRWVERLVEHGDGIALLFARTDTRWFQAAVARASLICFVAGRLAFVPGKPQRPGRRSPTDRPGAGSALLSFGKVCASAVERAGLGLCMTSQ